MQGKIHVMSFKKGNIVCCGSNDCDDHGQVGEVVCVDAGCLEVLRQVWETALSVYICLLVGGFKDVYWEKDAQLTSNMFPRGDTTTQSYQLTMCDSEALDSKTFRRALR